MNIQLYAVKKNFDQQKAERFFKERRIPVQLMDMKKHKLGRRELETFARAVGAQGLLDKEDKKVKEHPACYYNQDGMILDAMLEAPWLMRSGLQRINDDFLSRSGGAIRNGGVYLWPRPSKQTCCVIWTR